MAAKKSKRKVPAAFAANTARVKKGLKPKKGCK